MIGSATVSDYILMSELMKTILLKRRPHHFFTSNVFLVFLIAHNFHTVIHEVDIKGAFSNFESIFDPSATSKSEIKQRSTNRDQSSLRKCRPRILLT